MNREEWKLSKTKLWRQSIAALQGFFLHRSSFDECENEKGSRKRKRRRRRILKETDKRGDWSEKSKMSWRKFSVYFSPFTRTRPYFPAGNDLFNVNILSPLWNRYDRALYESKQTFEKDRSDWSETEFVRINLPEKLARKNRKYRTKCRVRGVVGAFVSNCGVYKNSRIL